MFVYPLEKTTLGLNFSVMEPACCSATHMCFDHSVIRARFCTSPRKEATSCSVNLCRELFQVVDRIVTKSARVVSGILIVRSLVLFQIPS